jgi:ribonucleotide reductase alpha subunit
MVEDKVGIKEYLGIKINYSNEKLLDKFSLDTLKDRYLWDEETHAQEAFARASVFAATYKGHTDFELAQRLYHYSSNCWFMFSTPILSNGGTSRGLPISCFLNYVPDSRTGLSDHYDENIWLASSGGGIGGYWGDIRSNGISTTHGSRSTGSIPFIHVVDSQMLAFNQGTTRRGSYAAYMDISHPEIEEFINMRKESGGDINRKNLNLHNGINITNEFLKAVEEDSDFRLIDPKTNEPTKIVNARDLWWQIINARAETGEPYMVNIDRCNEALPKEQKDLGLEIKQSNLCSEITLPTKESTMQTLKGFKNILSRVKKALLNLPTRLIEKGRWVSVRWASIRISNHATFLLKVSSLRASTIKLLNTLKHRQPKLLKDLQRTGVKLLMSVVVAGGTLIYSLLLLTLVLVSYVVVLLLRLSHIVLTFIRTRLSQVRSKLRTNT